MEQIRFAFTIQQTEFFEIPLKNPFNHEERFEIQFTDEQHLPNSPALFNLEILSNKDEWAAHRSYKLRYEMQKDETLRRSIYVGIEDNLVDKTRSSDNPLWEVQLMTLFKLM